MLLLLYRMELHVEKRSLHQNKVISVSFRCHLFLKSTGAVAGAVVLLNPFYLRASTSNERITPEWTLVLPRLKAGHSHCSPWSLHLLQTP